MIVYFTGTGNSRYCAQMLADKLDDEIVDAFHFIRNGIPAELISGKPWIFVAPTYGWQLPRIFVDFIRSGSFLGSKDAYFVMTCGSEIGNPEPKNKALCEEIGLRFLGTLEVVMPENYIVMFNAPGQDKACEIVAAAQPMRKRGCPYPGKKGFSCSQGVHHRQAEVRLRQRYVLSNLREIQSLFRFPQLHWLRQM